LVGIHKGLALPAGRKRRKKKVRVGWPSCRAERKKKKLNGVVGMTIRLRV